MEILKKQITLGSAPVTIQKFGLGTAHIANGGEKKAVSIVEEAWNQNIRFFDTAPLYAGGRSEEAIGTALSGISRDDFVLATKVGRLVQPDRSCIFDFSRDGILRSLEESLRRLKMDRVDILHIHDPDDHYQQALHDAYPALDDLRSQGVIRAVGSGMNQWEMLADFARSANFDCFLLAGRYTLLEQTSLDFLQLCRQKGIGVILGGVYNSGILASDLGPDATYNYEAAPQSVRDKAERIREVCLRHEVPLHVAALHFPLRHPAVSSMVIGAEEPSQVLQNLTAFETAVPAALWSELRTAGLIEGP